MRIRLFSRARGLTSFRRPTLRSPMPTEDRPKPEAATNYLIDLFRS